MSSDEAPQTKPDPLRAENERLRAANGRLEALVQCALRLNKRLLPESRASLRYRQALFEIACLRFDMDYPGAAECMVMLADEALDGP